MESLECRHAAERPWASHFTFLGLYFLTYAVRIMIKISPKVMETRRVTLGKFRDIPGMPGDMGLTPSPWPYNFGAESVPFPTHLNSPLTYQLTT